MIITLLFSNVGLLDHVGARPDKPQRVKIPARVDNDSGEGNVLDVPEADGGGADLLEVEVEADLVAEEEDGEDEDDEPVDALHDVLEASGSSYHLGA